MRNQRFRYAGVNRIMRHLIADAIGAPSECELAQVAGADDERVVQIRNPKQVTGPLSKAVS